MPNQAHKLVLAAICQARRFRGERADEGQTAFQSTPPTGPDLGIGQALLTGLSDRDLKCLNRRRAEDLLEHKAVAVSRDMRCPDGEFNGVHVNVTALHHPVIRHGRWPAHVLILPSLIVYSKP